MNSEPKNAAVGIIMGSRSDWETMRHASDTLAELDIACDVQVVSAHRTPDLLFEYAATAIDRRSSCRPAPRAGMPGRLSVVRAIPRLGPERRGPRPSPLPRTPRRRDPAAPDLGPQGGRCRDGLARDDHHGCALEQRRPDVEGRHVEGGVRNVPDPVVRSEPEDPAAFERRLASGEPEPGTWVVSGRGVLARSGPEPLADPVAELVQGGRVRPADGELRLDSLRIRLPDGLEGWIPAVAALWQ